MSSTGSVFKLGVYGAGEALRLINFDATTANPGPARHVSRQTITRWLRGYSYHAVDGTHDLPPLWTPDYANDDHVLEVSFRDLIELRCVKAFRDAGVSLPTIRQCFERAVDLVQDARPFTTQRFRTDGRTIFLDITRDLEDGALIDLKQRQAVFRSFVAPSLKDLDFEAHAVARWFPLGRHRTVLIDPTLSFGRPVSGKARVPTEALAGAVAVEGSVERVAHLFEVSAATVRDAIAFQASLAA